MLAVCVVWSASVHVFLCVLCRVATWRPRRHCVFAVRPPTCSQPDSGSRGRGRGILNAPGVNRVVQSQTCPFCTAPDPATPLVCRQRRLRLRCALPVPPQALSPSSPLLPFVALFLFSCVYHQEFCLVSVVCFSGSLQYLTLLRLILLSPMFYLCCNIR